MIRKHQCLPPHKHIEYTIIDSEIKFREETEIYPIGTDIEELANEIGYGKIINDGKEIKVIRKIKI